MKKIILLCATARVPKFMKTYSNWISNAKSPELIETHVAVNTDIEKQILLSNDNKISIQVTGNNSGVCKPIYSLSKDLNGNSRDIIVVINENLNCIPSWDSFFYSLFDFYNGSIILSDGYQTPDIANPIITMPLMTYSCLERLNYVIFNPTYNHYFASRELYNNLKDLGSIRDLRNSKAIFEFSHYSNGKRVQDHIDINNLKNWDIDKKTYEKRLQMKVEDRLIYET